MINFITFILLFININSSEVFICTGGNSKRFHLDSKCEGLDKCSAEIKKITKEEAENLGRTLCKIER